MDLITKININLCIRKCNFDIINSNLFPYPDIIMNVFASYNLLNHKIKKMEVTKKLTLIEGSFTAGEAKEILLNIFSTKINFHEMKNFSSLDRYGKEDELSKMKILKLKNEIENVFQLVSVADLNKNKLMITSEINISLSES
jgi:hypothetical protein